MRSRGIVVAVVVLLGLLGLASGLFVLGRRESEAKPSATSYSPSGTSALRQLLEKNGFHTDVTNSVRPRIGSDDLLIIFGYAEAADVLMLRGLTKLKSKTEEAARSHLQAGGHVLLLPMDKNFQTASQKAETTVSSLKLSGDERNSLRVNGSSTAEPYTSVSYFAGIEASDGFSILQDQAGTDFAMAFRDGPGRIVSVRDGIFATNRFIDREQNADVALRLVKALAHSGGRVVFDEAAFGEAVEPGLLESIGPWAEAMWFQLLFLFVVVVYSLGKRFGLAEHERPPQQGTRELLDAVSDTLTRGKMTTLALTSAADASRIRLLQELRLPADIAPGAFRDALPLTLQHAFVEVSQAAAARTKPETARKLIQNLHREVAALLGPDRNRSRRSATSLH